MLDEAVSVEVVRHFCHIASSRLGVGIGDKYQTLVAGRVAKRLLTLQLDVDKYVERLNTDHECSEVVGFLDFLRPRPPRFFARRDDHAVLHTGLVRWLKEGKRRIRLWSAGCGTGEEAYGMALTLLAALDASGVGLHEVDIKILATDISKPILERGKRGIFHPDQLRDVPGAIHRRYFRETNGGVVIGEDVREMVYFRRLNLTRIPYPMVGPLEAVFCRDGLAPLVRSARRRVADALKALVGEAGILRTGFGDDELPGFDDHNGRISMPALFGRSISRPSS